MVQFERKQEARKPTVALWFISLQVLLVVQCAAQQNYAVTDLGTAGGAQSFAWATNNAGQVVGYSLGSNGNSVPFVWQSGVLSRVGTLGGTAAQSWALGVNNSGSVVGQASYNGSASASYTHAFLWSGGASKDLGTLGGVNSTATGINDSGDVVGFANLSGDGSAAPFLYSNGNMIQLAGNGDAWAINSSSQIVGDSGGLPFLYANGQLKTLANLVGTGSAYGINDSGTVVGEVQQNPRFAETVGFVWNGGSATYFAPLPGYTSCSASGINQAGQVVGTSQSATGISAMLFAEGVVYDLNSLIPPNSGWVIQQPTGINNLGQIVGGGIHNGQYRAFLLTPSPLVVGVTNAASGQSGPIAPGEIISIFANAAADPIGPAVGVGLQLGAGGRVSTSLGGVQVVFLPTGVYAPLTYAGAGQINAVVPYEIAGLSNVTLQIQYQQQVSIPINLAVVATAPGIFTLNGTGAGQGAILNHDGVTVNGPTQPEPRGGTVVLFLTGEGQTSPAGASGAITVVSPTPPLTPAPIASVAVLINGQSATVAFAGEAPGFISGVLQLNVIIPLTISPGTVPIQVSVGGKSSPNVVTVSVK